MIEVLFTIGEKISLKYRSDLWFPIYIELKVASKCGSWTLGDFWSWSKKPNGEAQLHDIGSCKCVWEIMIWKHYQQSHGGGFCRFDPPMQELHSRKLRKILVYEINAKCSHWSMQTHWRSTPRCSCIIGYQWNQWFIYPTSN